MIVVLWQPIISRMVAIEPVERARLSSRVTISTSPAPRAPIAQLSCDRSVLAPLATSRNTFATPAAFKAATCAATLWPSVETLVRRASEPSLRPKASVSAASASPRGDDGVGPHSATWGVTSWSIGEDWHPAHTVPPARYPWYQE
jgi:hypothetical protein